jgi:SAM-dependent methyltransferase
MNLIDRNESIITGGANLEPLHVIPKVPVFFGCVDHPQADDLYVDMRWMICPDSGVIQLDKLIPPEVLYQEQHMDGTGPTWAAYCDTFSDFLVNRIGTKVIEIGGGAGKLAEAVVAKRKDCRWTIVEANPLHPGGNRIEVNKQYFDNRFTCLETPDTVVFSQVLEHAYDPGEFLKTIFRILPGGGKLCFGYPDLKHWLERKFTNAINFEHSMLLTDYFVDYLLAREGFEIHEKTAYDNHHFFYSCVKARVPAVLPRIVNHYDEYKRIYCDYRSYYESLVQDLNQRVKDFAGPVFVFGAHIFAQALFQFGLDEARVEGLLDNSRLKQGRRLYGSRLRVFSPETIRGLNDVAVILKVGLHRDGILDQLKSINPNVVVFE